MSNAIPATDAPPAPALWQPGVVGEIVRQTSTITSFFFRLPRPFRYRAGQHVDVRLTAPDGYSASRSYSIASAPDDSERIELAIERFDSGEVSSFFHEIVRRNDEIELRGPLGGHFVWPAAPAGPVLLIGAGSGLVPLISMLRYACTADLDTPIALLLSARTWDEVLFRDELVAFEVELARFWLRLAITRERPRRMRDFGRRIDSEMVIETVADLPEPPAHVFVCGSNDFVNRAVDGALAAGLPAGAIRTERYGE